MDNLQKKNTFGFVAPEVRALIVDDNKMDRALLRDFLTEMEIIADRAHDGAEAVEMTDNNKYDIIFMDQQMPKMSGSDATQKIRKNENYITVPIIAITADTSEYTRCLLMYEGTNDCVFKPISKERIGDLIKKWIPKDKIKAVALTSSDSDKELFGSIEEIDFDAAIQFLGSKKLYREFVTQYVRAYTRRKSSLLDAYTAKDFNKYAMSIHGIKVSSNQIGAYKLAEFAENLENAARTEDNVYMDKQNDSFLKEFDTVVQKIRDLNLE